MFINSIFCFISMYNCMTKDSLIAKDNTGLEKKSYNCYSIDDQENLINLNLTDIVVGNKILLNNYNEYMLVLDYFHSKYLSVCKPFLGDFDEDGFEEVFYNYRKIRSDSFKKVDYDFIQIYNKLENITIKNNNEIVNFDNENFISEKINTFSDVDKINFVSEDAIRFQKIIENILNKAYKQFSTHPKLNRLLKKYENAIKIIFKQKNVDFEDFLCFFNMLLNKTIDFSKNTYSEILKNEIINDKINEKLMVDINFLQDYKNLEPMSNYIDSADNIIKIIVHIDKILNFINNIRKPESVFFDVSNTFFCKNNYKSVVEFDLITRVLQTMLIIVKESLKAELDPEFFDYDDKTMNSIYFEYDILFLFADEECMKTLVGSVFFC